LSCYNVIAHCIMPRARNNRKRPQAAISKLHRVDGSEQEIEPLHSHPPALNGIIHTGCGFWGFASVCAPQTPEALSSAAPQPEAELSVWPQPEPDASERSLPPQPSSLLCVVPLGCRRPSRLPLAPGTADPLAGSS
jgi:hypothetical protein